MYRSFLLLIAVTLYSATHAQEPATAEIKAKKIKQQTIVNKYSDGSTRTTIYYYDAMGNDTATYSNGKRENYKVISYNNKKNIDKIVIYNNEGNEKETNTYTYKPDGSYTMINKDAAFGLAYNYSYDKMGKILQYRIPDGTVIKYTYNAKGQLIKMQNIPGDPSEKGYTTTYKYNAKNKIATATTSASVLYYEYGSDGLLKKIGNKAGSYSTTYQYQY